MVRLKLCAGSFVNPSGDWSKRSRKPMQFSKIMGFSGTCIVAAAYIPQIRHLIKEHCSAGISIRAYSLWFLAALFFLAYAGMIGDIVFIIAQVLNLSAICAIVIYAKRYENGFCLMHRYPSSGSSSNVK